MPRDRRDHVSMLSTRSATALYVGAVLGPGVLILPSLAAEAAGPASVLAWAGLLALSVPLAITFAVLGVRQPEAGGTAAYARAAFGRRAGAVTGWWFLGGVVLGAPAVAMVGGFYVAELLGAGREAAVVAAAGMIAAVVRPTRAAAHHGAAAARARRRARGAAARRGRERAAGEPRGELDPVRPARLGRGRHRGEPADALVHRLGGGLAPRRRAARPRAPAPAGDLRRARRSWSCSTSGSRSRRSACSAPRAVRRAARRPDGRRASASRAAASPPGWPCCSRWAR